MKNNRAAHPNTASACPCGSGQLFRACCGPRLDGSAPAPDAEALMRSRYTAYTRADQSYLQASWHPSTRPPAPEEPSPDHPARIQWLGLEVRQHRQIDATHAEVEFVARYRVGGRAHRQHEISRFVQEEGRWFYLDGEAGDSAR